jgi:hypothetical protein
MPDELAWDEACESELETAAGEAGRAVGSAPGEGAASLVDEAVPPARTLPFLRAKRSGAFSCRLATRLGAAASASCTMTVDEVVCIGCCTAEVTTAACVEGRRFFSVDAAAQLAPRAINDDPPLVSGTFSCAFELCPVTAVPATLCETAAF